MRRKIVAGNWKMNKNLQEGKELLQELGQSVKGSKCSVVVSVPYIHLESAVRLLSGSEIEVGAENCSDHAFGAYTGEISAGMIASTGATYCIIGHSERRQYYHETYEILRDKVDMALGEGLLPIFCVGEVKEEREANCQREVVRSQLERSLFHLRAEDFAKVIIAYEPVWAIGTGVTATPAEAEQMHTCIRGYMEEVYGHEIADAIPILYGGSCNEKNAGDLFQTPNVDGGLIGGASLVPEKFISIIEAMNALI